LKYPKLRPLFAVLTLGLTVSRWIIIIIYLWNGSEKEKRNFSRETQPSGAPPPQISHGLARDRNRSPTLRGRRITAWAMTRPLKHEAYLNNTKNQFPASEKPIGISIKTTWQYRLFRKRNDLYSDNIIKHSNTAGRRNIGILMLQVLVQAYTSQCTIDS
jgi:hypothetical protein